MDPVQFQKWLKERGDSDDELDAIIANHILLLRHATSDDGAIQAILDRKHGGSRIGQSPNLLREHAEGHARIMRDYFGECPKYLDHIFRRRFQMRRSLFMHIHDKILETTRFFVQRPDALGNPGLSSIQKMVAAMRMLTHGVAGDDVDEYVQIGESIAINSFKQFAHGIVCEFEDEYLRAPTQDDLKKHMDHNLLRGFPGMFGSLDCTHWVWKNCPYSLQGQYQNKEGLNSIILEAICTANLWIWHAFIGIPGSNNDINVVDRSPLLVNMLFGMAQFVNFDVNGHNYNMFYLLTDGIYPDYTIFVKTISNPEGGKTKYFAKRQEAVRKDIERCFGVLQARFAMIRNPSNWWEMDFMIIVWKAAIIMHNMIIEDEQDDEDLNNDYLFEQPAAVHIAFGRPPRPLNFFRLTAEVTRIKSKGTVKQLQEDLIVHLWEMRGIQNED